MKTLFKNYSLRKYSNRVALINKNKEVTYSQLYASADFLSEFFTERGLSLILCDNSLENYLIYYRILINKSIPMLISSEVDEITISKLINAYQPKYIFFPESKSIKVNNKNIQHVSSYGYKYITFNNSHPLHDDLQQLLTTSGSTGTQKFVKQSLKNFNSNCFEISKYLNIQPTDKVITTLPLSYTYGLSVINTHILSGASVYFSNYSLMEKTFWQEIENHQITTFNGVPFIYEVIKKLNINKLNLDSIKTFTQAGGKLDEKLQCYFGEYCIENNKDFFIMYGQAEATTRMSYLPSTKILSKLNSVGIPFGDGKFEIINDNAKRLAANESGRIFFYGSNVCMGYANTYKDLINDNEFQEVLDTGDLGYLDSDGYLYISGKSKRFAKLYGNSINLDELDTLLHEKYPNNIFASVEKNNKLAIFSDITSSKPLLLYISKILKLPLSSFKFVEIPEIPRLKNHKIDFSALKTLLY